MPNTELIPKYETMLFSDIFPSQEDFISLLNASNFAPMTNFLEDDNKTLLYYLLYAEYGNTPIANRSVNQFNIKLITTIFKYGPTWQKNLEMQKKLRDLTDEELMTGSKMIYNMAANNNGLPTTDTSDEVPYLYSQNVNKNKRGKLEAYDFLNDLLKADVSSVFIKKFKDLFVSFVVPPCTDIFVSEYEEDDYEY